MNKFRKLGFIDYNGSIEVHSSLLNLILHEEPHIEAYPLFDSRMGMRMRRADILDARCASNLSCVQS
jgi:hypothetical protein